MSLSQRIKEVIHSPESEAASRGEVDSRTPGSFPTDDMNAHTSDDINTHHHERNKLHKPNDPRAGGHKSTDSGVGIMSSENDEPAVTREPVEDAYRPAAGEEQEERAKRSAAVPGESDRYDEGTTAPGYDEQPEALGTTLGGATLGSNDKQSPGTTNAVRTGKQKSTTAHPDPYWGNIEPGQGHGVYNTVTGHGSKEDEMRHSAQTGSYNTTENTGQQRAFPLVGHHNAHTADPTRRNVDDTTTTTTTTTSAGSSTQPAKSVGQPTTQHEARKSNWNGPVGAAVLGAAGTSTFAADQGRNVPTVEGDNDHIVKEEKYDETNRSETSSEKKRGGILGMFHRGEKDKEEKQREKEAKKEQRKEEKLMSREEEKRLETEGHRPESDNHQPPPDAVAAASAAMRNDRAMHGDPRAERPMLDDGRPAEWRDGDGPGVPTTDPRVVAPGPGARVARDIYNHNHPEQAVEGQPLDGFAPHERIRDRHLGGAEPTTSLKDDLTANNGANEGQYDTSRSHPEQASSTVPIMAGTRHPATEAYSARDDDLSTTSRANAGQYDTSRTHTDQISSAVPIMAGTRHPATEAYSGDKGDLSNANNSANMSQYGASGSRSEQHSSAVPIMAGTRHPATEAYSGRKDDLSTTTGANVSQYGTSHSHPEQTSSAVPIMAGTRHPATEAYSGSQEPATSIGNMSSSQQRNIPSAEGRGASAQIPHVTEEANAGHYNVLSSGTPSGAAVRSQPEQASSAAPMMAGTSTSHSATEAYSGSHAPTTSIGNTSTSQNRGIPATGDRTSSAHIPHVTEEANAGHYNLLSSGTPSGVRLDDSSSHGYSSAKATSGVPRAVDSQTSRHGAAGTAGMAAAGTTGVAAAGAATTGMATSGMTGSRTATQEQGSGCPATELLHNH